MNKAELIKALAESLGIEKSIVSKVVDATFEGITAHIKAGGEVQIVGFGTFAARWRKARDVAHPRDPSQRLSISSLRVPRFKAGSRLKQALREPIAPPT